MRNMQELEQQAGGFCRRGRLVVAAASVVMVCLTSVPLSRAQSSATNLLNPSKMPMIATVDERYQSFNVEMVEVTGGRFWAPYKKASSGPAAVADVKPASTPGGMDPSLYRYRAPIDLYNPQLRKLASALGPIYLRVSGTWANTTYFQDTDAKEAGAAPAGFGGVLTRPEWKGVLDFSHALNAKIVTSFAVGTGVRDANGLWTPVEAEKFLRFTKSAGGSIAVTEFFNEPTFAGMGGAPKGYDAAAYGRDFKIFRDYLRKASPETKLVGPGSVGEGRSLGQQSSLMHMITSEDMLTAEGPGLDGFSYHFYGGVSKRCGMLGASSQATPEQALSADWLTRTDFEEKYYAKLRDRFEPGKPMWLTETGETACGGNPWASSFADSFRYLHQLGSLAKLGVQSVMHNTLAASDYALIDESTLTPRPNYWSAVLWSRLMGAKVLEAGSAAAPNQYLYAQCLRDHPGGVALLAINADRAAPLDVSLGTASIRYELTATDLLGGSIQLNGKELQLTLQGDLPALVGAPEPAGKLILPATSIAFFAIPDAKNAACR